MPQHDQADNRPTDPNSTLRLFHEAALESLHALVRLHDLVLRYDQLPLEERTKLRPRAVCEEYLLPFIRAQQKLGGNLEHEHSFRLMMMARLVLRRGYVTFRGMP